MGVAPRLVGTKTRRNAISLAIAVFFAHSAVESYAEWGLLSHVNRFRHCTSLSRMQEFEIMFVNRDV